jgi:hypothetical protein
MPLDSKEIPLSHNVNQRVCVWTSHYADVHRKSKEAGSIERAVKRRVCTTQIQAACAL